MRGFGRRRKYRYIDKDHDDICFKPCSKRAKDSDMVILYDDEMEALRLCDFEGLYQQEASESMKISRTTLSRVVSEARKKVVDALLHEKILIVKKRDKQED